MSIWIIALIAGLVIGIVAAIWSVYPRTYKVLGIFALSSIVGFLLALAVIALASLIR